MYSYEIEQLLKLRNYIISNEEYFKICETSPQINRIEYKPFEQQFYINTDDNYCFEFKVYQKK